MPDDGNVVPLRRQRRAARWLAQWPISVVLFGVVIACALIAADYFRRGAVVLAASVLLAAFLRLLLPDADAGMLVVRSKRVDVITLGLLAVGLTVFAFWVPAPTY